MNFKKLYALLPLLIAACGPLPEENLQQGLLDRDQNIETTQVDIIATKEKITEEFKIGPVDVGDVVEVSIKGRAFKDQFSEAYFKGVSSQWEEQHCVNDPPERPDRPGRPSWDKRRDCTDETKRGNCQAKYRDYLGEKEGPLIFPNDISKVKLKYRIDGKLYDLGQVTSFADKLITVKFEVKKELVEYSNHLDLVVLSDVSEGNVTVGFLGLGSCDGRDRRGFQTNASTASQVRQAKTRFEFFADIKIVHAK